MAGWIVMLWVVAEVAAIVVVGQQIGVLATVALFFGTSLLGLLLLRLEGIVLLWQLLRWVDETQQRGEIEPPPLDAIAGSLPRLFGGLLLVLPGFVSDALGLVLLLPPGRWWLSRRIERWLLAYWRERGATITAHYHVHPAPAPCSEPPAEPAASSLLELPPPDPHAH
ncbi:MAG: FxsA family protein [Planctomycetota bacterium]|nr:MAG: FxsA family protein [Planctomycetota bacterium]